MMKNMVGMMKKVQEMQDNVKELQAEMEQASFTASIGGSAVSVTLNGKGIMQSIKIDPDALDPAEVDTLEDMICLATNNARAEADAQMAARMKEITGDLPLPPGMTLPF